MTGSNVTHRFTGGLAVRRRKADIRIPYLRTPGSCPTMSATVTTFNPAAPASRLAQPQSAELESLRPGLRMIALRALGDADAADEAVQEALARAVAALSEGRLVDPAKLPAYAASITRHVCFHVIRDRKKTVSIDNEAGEIMSDPRLHTHTDPLEALIDSSELKRLRDAFRALPSADQRLLRLSFLEEHSSADIAAALGEPADRVRKRKSRALDRLRRAFLGEPEGHEQAPQGTISRAPTPESPRTTDND